VRQKLIQSKAVFGVFMLAAAGLSACASLKVPDFDSLNFPDFREEAENIGDYPSAAEAPQVPTDLRPDEAWDNAAKDLIARRDALPPAPMSQGSAEQLARDMEMRGETVEDYKIDDPQ
jgi:hypothetical protein